MKVASRTITTKPLAHTRVFSPVKIGDVQLEHRVVHLACTRNRASDHEPTDLQYQYYTDRSNFPGTLLISEATSVSVATGSPLSPGIWSNKMVEGWKQITDKVHQQGSFMAAQLWHMGRAGNPLYLKKNGLPLLGASAIYTEEQKQQAEKVENPIREMSHEEIHDVIHNQFGPAVQNAMKAGFDFVELHLGNGYLFEQFLHPSSNQRTDEYGGSVENRSRIILELVDHLLTLIPAQKLGIRIAPFIDYAGFLGLQEETSPLVSYGYVLDELQKRADNGSELGYVNVVNGTFVAGGAFYDASFVRKHWHGSLILGGNYSADEEKHFGRILRDIDDNRTAVGFGRHFVSNPDLVFRLQKGLELTPADRDTLYKTTNLGYNTYPEFGQQLAYDEAEEKKRAGTKLV